MVQQRVSRGRFGAAAILIIIGVLFLLRNMQIVHIGSLVHLYWPSIFIIIGIYHLITARNGRYIGALIFILIGAYIQAAKLGWLGWEWYSYWPVILIIIGLWILMKPRTKNWWPGNTLDADKIDLFTMFSGAHKAVQSINFTGGELTAIMGGMEIDFRQSKTSQKEMFLNVTVIMGGIEITVPQTWRININITPLLGGVDDNRRNIQSTLADDTPILHINGTVIMGGVEIKD